MWIVKLSYQVPLEKVEEFIEEHRTFLDRISGLGCLLASGPMVPRNGGVILVRKMERSAVEAMFENDPFMRERIATYEFTDFRPTKGIEPLISAE